MNVRMYVRTYVWSCLVIALATLFQVFYRTFLRNVTQVFSMARPRTSSRFMILRQRSRSLLLFSENLCHRSSDFIYGTILTKLHTSVQYGKTSNEFAFHVSASKVKVTVTIFIKSLPFCHRSSDFIYGTILTKLHTSVQYGKTSNEFAFHDATSKVKVTVTIFRKSLSSL
jgi:hypothetical protein